MEAFIPRFESHKTMKINRDSLTIPKEYAELINKCHPPRCFVTIAPGRLLVYPLSVWESFADHLENSPELEHRQLLQIYRKYGYRTTELDSSNRIKISPIHLSFLQNPRDVVIAGQGNRLEVYRLEDHLSELEQLTNNPVFSGPEGVLFNVK